MSSLIKLIDITKVYTKGEVKTPILHGIDITIQENELLAIMGASGSGKSSLMNIIGLLDKQTSGKYLLDGIDTFDLSAQTIANIRNQKIGFIFQAFFLLPMLTIQQNVGLPLTYRDMDEASINRESALALERVGLEHLINRLPNELSGGQQQRVAIARALVGKPNVILADEPTGALDSKIGQEIMELFIQLNQLDQNTIIIITHDKKIADQCPRTIHIKDGLIIE